jgi:pilus assembly protein Flp/PilA
MSHMKTLLKNLLGDKAGASAAEYALILAVVAIGVVGAFTALQTAISGRVTAAGTTITTGK